MISCESGNGVSADFALRRRSKWAFLAQALRSRSPQAFYFLRGSAILDIERNKITAMFMLYVVSIL